MITKNLILRSARSARLEGWATVALWGPCFETAAARPPQHEVGLLAKGATSC